MRKKRLGRTAMVVSEVGFGGIPITRTAMAAAVDIIRHCFKLGVTFFDTARLYGDSEEKLGAALVPHRQHVFLATKTMARDSDGAAADIQKSLSKLRTDRIDLYQTHSVSKLDDLERILAPGGAYKALLQAKQEGFIGHIGLSSHNPEVALKACKTNLFETLQFPFNFVEHDPANELFKVAEQQGMGLIGMKPMGGGLLNRPDLCFRFLQRFDSVVPIAGIQSEAEIDEIAELYRSPKPLSEGDWKEIETIRNELGEKFCHRCGYCMPCEQGVLIPQVLLFKPQTKRFPPEMVFRLADKPMKSAEECIECGECRKKCPYGLPVPELLIEYRGLFNDFIRKHSLLNGMHPKRD
jgi:predicted aldo/keto reductase-like oxidoreductase